MDFIRKASAYILIKYSKCI